MSRTSPSPPGRRDRFAAPKRWGKRLRRWFHKGQEAQETIEEKTHVEVGDTLSTVSESVAAGEIPAVGALDTASFWSRLTAFELPTLSFPTDFTQIGSALQRFTPGAMSRVLGAARSRWALVGVGWSAFLIWSQSGGLDAIPSESARAALQELSAPTLSLVQEIEDFVQPLQDSVSRLAEDLSASQVDRLRLPDRLRAEGGQVDGLVDLTVAYQPYSSPAGNRLDAPSYRPDSDTIIQREAVEDYATRASSLERGPSWYDVPLSAQSPAWALTSFAIPNADEADADTPPGLSFGVPFAAAGAAPGTGFDGVVSATIGLDQLAAQVDDVADEFQEKGVNRVYVLGPEGEVVHRSGGHPGAGRVAAGFRTLFDGSPDPTEVGLKSFANRILSGVSGGFALEDLAATVAGARSLAPSWVEHRPIPGTNWTLAVVYSPEFGLERQKVQQRPQSSSMLGLAALGALFAMTTAAAASGFANSRKGEPPPWGSSRMPDELDYPDAPAFPGLFAASGASVNDLDAINRHLLSVMVVRGARTPPVPATSLTASTTSPSTSNSANSALPLAGTNAANGPGNAANAQPAPPPPGVGPENGLANVAAGLVQVFPADEALPLLNLAVFDPLETSLVAPSSLAETGRLLPPSHGLEPNASRYNLESYLQVPGGLGSMGFGAVGGGENGFLGSGRLTATLAGHTPPDPRYAIAWPPRFGVQGVPEPSSVWLVLPALLILFAVRLWIFHREPVWALRIARNPSHGHHHDHVQRPSRPPDPGC